MEKPVYGVCRNWHVSFILFGNIFIALPITKLHAMSYRLLIIPKNRQGIIIQSPNGLVLKFKCSLENSIMGLGFFSKASISIPTVAPPPPTAVCLKVSSIPIITSKNSSGSLSTFFLNCLISTLLSFSLRPRSVNRSKSVAATLELFHSSTISGISQSAGEK